MLGLVVLVNRVFVIEFDVSEIVQDARWIRMIPEPTSPLYWISTGASACNELLLPAASY